MKKTILICLIALTAGTAFARGGNHGGGHRSHGHHQSSGHYTGTGSNPNSHHVNGYRRQDGTYVAPHHSTNPNQTQRDNYGTIGNYNPHNGQVGRRYAEN